MKKRHIVKELTRGLTILKGTVGSSARNDRVSVKALIFAIPGFLFHPGAHSQRRRRIVLSHLLGASGGASSNEMRSRVLLRLFAASRRHCREEVVHLPHLLRNGLRGRSEVGHIAAHTHRVRRRRTRNDAHDCRR